MNRMFINLMKAVTGFIKFSNPDDKDWAILHFDKNGDGELGKSEASKYRVSPDVGQGIADKNNEPVTAICSDVTDLSFFQFFKGITRINKQGVFRDAATIEYKTEKVVLPSTLAYINGGTNQDGFNGVLSLKHVEITNPNECTFINAFGGQTDMTVVIPSLRAWFNYSWDVTTAPYWAEETNKTICKDTKAEFGGEVSIPKEVTELHDGALSYNIFSNTEYDLTGFKTLPTMLLQDNTYVEKITTDANVIGSAAFFRCTSLKYITLKGNLTEITSSMLRGLTSLVTISLPSSVKAIGSSAFYGDSNLASVSMGNGVTLIASSAFYGCSKLNFDSLPNSITKLGSNCFYGCSSLALTSLPSAITTIPQGAFQNCINLVLTSLPNNITTIEQDAFNGCTAMNPTMPSMLKTIGIRAFNKCKALALTSLPDSVTSIQQHAFQDCTNLALTSLPNSIVTVGMGAFYNCQSLLLTELPLTLKSIEYGSFNKAFASTTLTLHDGIISIGQVGIANNTKLTEVRIGTGIKSINAQAFYGCNSLVAVHIAATTPPALSVDNKNNKQWFPSGATIYVPADSVNAYKEATYWNEFKEKIKEEPSE